MAYFVPDFDTTAPRAVLIWARDDFDGGDPWGWVMSWLFDIAAELDTRGDDVPEELGYRAGAFGSEVSEDRAEGLAEFTTDALTRAARVLHRFAECCKRAGRDY